MPSSQQWPSTPEINVPEVYTVQHEEAGRGTLEECNKDLEEVRLEKKVLEQKLKHSL